MVLFRDTSTGHMIRNSERNLTECESKFVPFGNECCLFMDDTTLHPTTEWNSGFTYSLGERTNAGNSLFESIQNDNLNHSVIDTDWWILIGPDSCGTSAFDSVAPYGGPGKSPKFYNIQYTVNWADDEGSTTLTTNKLPLLDIAPAGGCIWGQNGGIFDEQGQELQSVRLSLGYAAGVFTDYTVAVSFRSVTFCPGGLESYDFSNSFQIGDITGSNIAGSASWSGPNGAGKCAYKDLGFPNFVFADSFDFSWTPSG